jgi:hypothetical protein
MLNAITARQHRNFTLLALFTSTNSRSQSIGPLASAFLRLVRTEQDLILVVDAFRSQSNVLSFLETLNPPPISLAWAQPAGPVCPSVVTCTPRRLIDRAIFPRRSPLLSGEATVPICGEIHAWAQRSSECEVSVHTTRGNLHQTRRRDRSSTARFYGGGSGGSGV